MTILRSDHVIWGFFTHTVRSREGGYHYLGITFKMPALRRNMPPALPNACSCASPSYSPCPPIL